MSNGFSDVNVNKMIESSRNWNLANDVELLKCLEKFSENIINNATLTLSSMDDLEDSLNETFLKVRTVANKFQAIADNQFIENRVQEEEEFVLANDEKDSLENQISTEGSKAQLFDCIRDCQNAIGKKFETVQLSGIDLEDEMANSSPVVLVAKNVYKERLLPHLIGGEQFKTDDTIGLGPASDSVEDSIESDDDADETDRSSYYSSNATKDIIKQVAPVKPIVNPVTDFISRNSPPKYDIPDPPPLRSFFLSHEPPRIEDDPPFQPSALSSITLLPEAPGLHEPLDSLFCDVPEPTDTLFCDVPERPDTLFREVPKPPDTLFHGVPEPNNIGLITSNSLDDENDFISSNKTKNEVARSVPIKRSASREQLLSRRNFASFKEDLERVLSGVKPQRKQSSSDSDGSKSDLSSPAQGDTSHKFGATDGFSPPPVTSSRSSPANQSAPQSTGSSHISSPNVPSRENSSVVTLPSVSTNVLENLAKGRAKVKGRRRPPSRKHRQANIDEESTNGTNLDQNTNPSNSTHSEDTSVHESSSTQPGSNILSPATDEEDLFVLPAFDLPSDPPNRGLFFGNSLLSPGTTIDDGGLSNSPLFPKDSKVDVPSLDHTLPTSKIISNAPNYSRNDSPKISPTKRIVEPQIESKVSDSSYSSPADLFSSNKDEGGIKKQQSNAVKKSGELGTVPDLFSETSSMIHGLNEKLDIFSSTNNENKLSSSPPLFADWAQPSDNSKTNKKSATKSSMRSGLKWDLLGSNDLSEDLFRSEKKESLGIPSLEEPRPSKVHVEKKDKSNIFSPSLSFEQSGGSTLFEDESNYSAPDIFAESSSFMGLSLPKSSKNSLFASDDDEDDDSLFKSSKSSSVLKSPGSSTKPQETSRKTNTTATKNSSSRELVNDPLSSMD